MVNDLSTAWVAVDLDGTLAYYDGDRGKEHIGKVLQPMKDRVLKWLEEGYKVKIFTARAADPTNIPSIKKWLEENGLGGLEVTNKKDSDMMEIWDDRCVQMKPNTGEPVRGYDEGLYHFLLERFGDTISEEMLENAITLSICMKCNNNVPLTMKPLPCSCIEGK